MTTIGRHEGWADGVAGVRIHWQAWIPADTPVGVVVLHHGAAEHSGRYPHAVQHLVAAGYGVYGLDARGHGRSEGRRATFHRFDQLTTDLGTIVETVVRPTHPEPVFLMGYSLGGAAVIAYAIHHQDQLAGAIVVGSALGRGSGISRFQFGMASLFSAVAPRFPLIRLHAADMTHDAEVAKAYETDPLIHHGRFDARFLGEVATVMRRLPADFHRLRLPLLLLHGAADITADPEGSRALLQQAGSADKTLRLYAGRRHDVLNGPGCEQVMLDVTDWLAAHR